MNDIENKQELIESTEAEPETALEETNEAASEIVAEDELKTEAGEAEETPDLGDAALPLSITADEEAVAPESIAPASVEDSAAAIALPESALVENALEDQPPEPESKIPRRKWISMKFSAELVPLAPFDMHPVTDIIIRRAVEEGVKNSRDLAVYKTTEEWNGYPKDTILLAGLVEEGAPFAIWDPPKRRKKSEKQDEGTSEAEEKE